MMTLDAAFSNYLSNQSKGRLATVGPDGSPQNKPVGFVYNVETGTIDIAGFDMGTSAKYRNVGLQPHVAFVVDDVIGEGASGMRFVEIRGLAQQVSVDVAPSPGLSRQIIRIRPHRMIGWNIDPDLPGLRTLDMPARENAPGTRPVLAMTGAVDRRARQVAATYVDEMQAGWDRHDADLTDQHLAEDIAWGSPFGATVQGYEALHAIHVRLKQESKGGDSTRFEVVRVLAPTPDVVIAQVRRVALDHEGEAIEPTADTQSAFSEMALYVLVRRADTWWVAAGQNTLLRPPRS